MALVHAKGTPLLNEAASAGVEFLAEDIVPTNGRARLRFTISSDTATDLLCHVTELDDPSNTAAFEVLNGTDLAVSGCSQGDIDVTSNFSYNFSLAASGTVLYFVCQEIRD